MKKFLGITTFNFGLFTLKVITLLGLATLSSSAQTFQTTDVSDRAIDSLQKILVVSKEDTAKVNTLNALSKQYNTAGNYAQALEYATQAKQQAEKLNYQKGIADSFNNSGLAYRNLGDFEKSLDNYLTSLKISEELGYKHGIANSYNNIGNIYDRQGNYEKSLDYHSKALKIREELADNQGIANSCLNIGNAYLYQGNYAKALESYRKALKTDEGAGDKQGTAACHISIGLTFEYEGEYEKALTNYSISLKILEKIGNKKGIASAYNNIGNIYNFQGNYEKALNSYFASLTIREEILDQRGITDSYNSIGTVYEQQGNFEKAIENYFKSLKIREEIGDKKRMSGSYNNIGNTYLEQGDYEKAMFYHLKSLKITEEIGDKKGMAGSYTNIGLIYEKQEEHQKALDNHLKSLKIYLKISDKRGIASSYLNAGIVYYKQNKLKKASHYLNQSQKLFKEIGYKNGIKEAYFSLSELYNKKGDCNQSYSNYKLYILYRDSLDNEESRKKTIQSQMNYDFEKKEAIAKSKQEVKELKAKSEKKIIYGILILLVIACLAVVWFFIQRRKLDKIKAIQEKEALEKNKFELELKWFNSELKALRSQMNPHFIFNCMNSIQRFVLQNDSASAAKFLSKFARLIRSILENSEQAFIPLESEIKMLEDYLDLEKLRFGKKFNYSISVEDSINPELIEIPSMLIQPYIENSIIHGIGPRKDEDGRIDLTFKMTGNVLLCEISDNGVGRKKAGEIKKQMELAHKSMGMSILKERLELINAKENIDVYSHMIDLEDDDGISLGTKVELNIPLRKRQL